MLLGVVAIVASGSGVALASIHPSGAAPSVSAQGAQVITDSNGPTRLAAHGYYFLYVPCNATIHCALGVRYHTGEVTLTASVNNSTADVVYFYGTPSTVIPNLSWVHGQYGIGSTATTQTFSAWLCWIYNPHSTPITISFSYVVLFEDYGN
jgi:hypothetical protein